MFIMHANLLVRLFYSIWVLVVNTILKELDAVGSTVLAYAYDIVIPVPRKFTDTISDISEEAIRCPIKNA